MAQGSEILIVDNSDDNWKALRYLEGWAEISKAFDIASAYFEIGALLALDGKWQELEKLRILMGEEVTLRTKRAFAEALSKKETILDDSLENEKEANDFLSGVPAIVEAIKSGQIECRVYRKDKFHAKAYITHAKHEVTGSAALVGSSNFTFPGLTTNIELNVQLKHEVGQLQEWYERHWKDAEPVSTEILNVIERHTRAYTPFEVYVKALQELFRSHEETAHEWEIKGPDNGGSKVYPKLDQYQKEGYHTLIGIRNKYRGAFLCDGVGLGKTFMGLMLIERLVFHEKKNVVLFVPKSARKDVWESHLKEYLPDVYGAFVHLEIFNHTDIGREGDFPEQFKAIAERADAVVIDEAHNFRNPGTQGGGEKPRSRYWQLFDMIGDKECFFLTATPINNRLVDFRHMVELFSRKAEDFFASRLGIQSLRGHFTAMEKEFRQPETGDDVVVETNLAEAQEHLSVDKLFKALVVQRSRKYVKKSQEQQNKTTALFPERELPLVADYSVRKTYGKLLEMIEKAFDKESPLFELSIYYPMAHLLDKDKDKEEDTEKKVKQAFEEGRQKQVVSLIRTQFLKRFESSIEAFTRSCDRLLMKMLGFVTKHAFTKDDQQRLENWKHQNDEIIGYVNERQMELWGEEDDNEIEEDLITPDMLEDIEKLEPKEYDVATILNDTYLDMDQLIRFLTELKKFKPTHDDKLKRLIKLLKTDPVMKQHKVLIFTEYAETARYLRKQLDGADIEGLENIDGGSSKNRSDIVQRFAPYYNGLSSGELEAANRKEIRVLISTDVLSEGLNLQDATRAINYDIHWNPVRLMQRIGRVDRRMNPDVEKAILKDHPDQKKIRGKIAFWNFLPPDDLENLLKLYSKVSGKTLRISKTLGIEGRRLLKPEDHYDALRNFNEQYEGDTSPIEEMNLEMQRYLNADPLLEKRISELPGRVFSGKENIAADTQALFLCYRIPGPPPAKDDEEDADWTEEAGTTQWYLYQLADDAIIEEPSQIIESIRCEKNTKRRCKIERPTLRSVRLKVEKHINKTLLKSMQAPMGVNPVLKCWMELN